MLMQPGLFGTNARQVGVYPHEASTDQRLCFSQKLEKTVFNDEEQRRREIAVMRASDQQDRLKQAYIELKYTAPDKAADMREQHLLRTQMHMAYRTGDHDTANRLAERLKPDAQKEAEAARRPDA